MYRFDPFYDDTPAGRASIVMSFHHHCFHNKENIADTFYKACNTNYDKLNYDCNAQKKEKCQQLVDNGASYFCRPITGDGEVMKWCNDKNFKYEEINPTTVAPTTTPTTPAPCPTDPSTLQPVIITGAVCIFIGALLMFLIMLVVCKKKNGNGNGGVEGGTTQGTTRTGTRGTTTRTKTAKTRGKTTRTGTTQL